MRWPEKYVREFLSCHFGFSKIHECSKILLHSGTPYAAFFLHFFKSLYDHTHFQIIIFRRLSSSNVIYTNSFHRPSLWYVIWSKYFGKTTSCDVNSNIGSYRFVLHQWRKYTFVIKIIQISRVKFFDWQLKRTQFLVI